jgi:hypothetical protein
MERIELLWEKRQIFKDPNVSIVTIDDFLEACAHVNVTEIHEKPLERKTEDKDITIKPKLLNEDGTKTIESMTDQELAERSDPGENETLPF